MYQPLKHIIILFLLQLSSTVVAQDYTLSHRLINDEEGLLGSKVYSFVQDKNGFIWLATQRGIARYDGHQFKWFTEINSGLRGVPSGENARLVEDDKGNIWVLSGGKVDVINPSTFDIQPLETQKGFEALKEIEFGSLVQNTEQFVFLGRGSLLYYYHSSTGLVKVDFLPKNTKNIQPKGDMIWVSNNKKVFAYHLRTGKKLATFPVNDRLKIIKNHPDRDILWHSTDNALELFEFKNNQLEKIGQFDAAQNVKVRLRFVTYLPEKDLFVTNFNGLENGYSVIDIDNQRLIPIANSKDKLFQEAKIIRTAQKDISSIWTRTESGILLCQVNETHFQQYLPNEPIRGIKVIGDDIYADRFKISQKTSDKVKIQTKKGNTIWGVEGKSNQEIWIGTPNSLVQIDKSTNEPIQYIPSKFGGPKLWTIVKSKTGRWWAGCYAKKLLVSNFPKNDSLFLFNQYNDFEELENQRINHLLEDGDYIWASTEIGLFLIHQQKGVIKKYNTETVERARLPVNQVHSLYKDTDNVFWLATSSEGLVRFEINEQLEISTLKRYSIEDGLSSNVLYNILEDDKNQLWISTLNGLSCFDKQTEFIQTFSKKDGIQELEFNRNSYAKSEDGRLFFGSIKGITAFYPDKVMKTDVYDFPIYITRFASFKGKEHKLIDRTLKVQQSNEIILKPSERFFRMDVAMPDIFNSNKLNYVYKIEGLFDDFQLMNGNTIEIGGLPYGRYTLRVRGQGANKRFSQQELTIPLIVVRPFYLRWWFIALVLIIIAVSIFQLYQWRVRQLQERKKELELLVMERTAQIRKDKSIIEEQATQLKELDELKSKFFANISHELRTPLTLILAPLNKLINEPNRSNSDYTYLAMMRQNSTKLLKRINELLDLSKLDANRLEVNEQPTFLYPFFKTLLSTVESAANLKGIKLLFKYQLDEHIQINLDDDKVEKIVTNYLSNALKFTPKNGEIELNVSKKADKLHISVRDTGIGILPNDLIKIFDRFYQSKTEKQQEGTGIGLSLCRELAKVLGGKVWAISQIDQGSIFYLELPLVETFAIKPITEEETSIPTPILPTTTQVSTAQQFRPNILIVEDNPDLRQFLTMILQEDYNIQAVENGEEAWERLTVFPSSEATVNRQPSIVISDIMMPVMNGIELLAKVKSNKDLQHIPMIMLTARQSLDVKIEALRIGVDDYLTKPFREEELKARVANLIANSQNRQVISNNDDSSKKEKPTKAISAADLIWLKELETILKENINNSNFKIVDAAHQMAITQRRLQQKIKEITGLTPKQYQRSIRLNKARAILKSGEVRTISEVLHRIGIDNRHYFTKIYKEEFGIKPIEELR